MLKNNNERSLRAGFVGFGRMGITHFSILNPHPQVEIGGVADSSQAMGALLNKSLQVPTWTDYQKMLDEAALDFVVVSTPSASHGEIVDAVLERGLHVFVEKPLTLTGSQSRALAARVASAGVVGQVGYVNRFNEIFVEVRRLIRAGAIGDIRSFRSEMYAATITEEASGWRARRSEGGGCLYEFAAHALDLVVFLLGAPQRVGGSVLASVFSSEVEDLVSSTMFYENGCTGILEVNWSDASRRKPSNIISLFGTHGRIVADRYSFRIWLPEAAHGLPAGWSTRYITDLAQPVRFFVRGNAFTNQLDHFVDHVLSGDPGTRSTFAEAAHTDVLIESIRADATAISRPSRSRTEARTSRRATFLDWLSRILGVA